MQAISPDMSAAYLKAIREHDDVDATVCIDPFHVVQLAAGVLLGPRAHALAAWLHVGLGVPMAKVAKILQALGGSR